MAHITLALVILIAAIVYVIESGSVDRYLTEKARQQIGRAISPVYHAELEASTLRLGEGLKLELTVNGVSIRSAAHERVADVQEIALAINPLRLLIGQLSINSVSVKGVRFDPSALPEAGPFRLTDHRVDGFPVLVEQIFDQTDLIRGVLETAETQEIAISDLRFPLPSATPDQSVDINLRQVEIQLMAGGVLRVDGQVALDGTVSGVTAEAVARDGRTETLQAEVTNLLVTPFLLRKNKEGEPDIGVEATTDVAVQLKRADGDKKSDALVGLHVKSGRFVADRIARPFSNAQLNLSFDNNKKSFELSDSSINFDGSYFPFSGGIIDLDHIKPDAAGAFGVDFLVSGGQFKSREPGLPPLLFDAQVSGAYRADEKALDLDRIMVTSPQGNMDGAFTAVFGDASPALTFNASIDAMDTEAVKQMWPFWIARKPREWVTANIGGGRISNGTIMVDIPAGRIEGEGIPLNLGSDELKIDFDIDKSRLTIKPTFPDVIGASAHVLIDGERLNVAIRSGYFDLGNQGTVAISDGTFEIADTSLHPPVGRVDALLSGQARAIVQLAADPPINALDKTDFTPADFTGTGSARVRAELPITIDDGTSEPDDGQLPRSWSVDADLTDVAVAKPIDGHTVSNIDGKLSIVPGKLALKGKAAVDGVAIDIDWSLPLDSEAGSASLNIGGTLSEAQREAMYPGLSTILKGPVSIEASSKGNDGQVVSLDLTKSTMVLPWIGWQKPAGQSAKLRFTLKAGDGGVNQLSDLQLSGSGLAAAGTITLDKEGLSSLDLSHVSLTADDDFNVSIKRVEGNLVVNVSGKRFSAEPMLSTIKKDGHLPTDGGSGDAKRKNGAAGSSATDNVSVSIALDRIMGLGGRYIDQSKGSLSVVNGDVDTAALGALTATGKSVSLQVAPTGDGRHVVKLNTDGAGSLLRFLGVYPKMSGGQLALNMIEAGGNWSGNVEIEDFRIIDDDQLKTFLSAPSGRNGQSLNARFNNRINSSNQHFQRASIDLVYAQGVLQINNGVLRGEQVGATFKGVARDAAGNIDMTGTFMPAYGLNRIFAEIPIIGPILGNGNDKGLFGITFKLTGKSEKPQLVINPLSAIAPGVFRKIFEFQ
ncbi:DUF3971 domain-containing protein [Martelella alba]|uniref:DUF3971 domain-containing protein n=1 Tax=Martelella alba TaxID=2590451 RepID=A0A506U9Q6_9HYPH|nr:DUF3971 domain-containing protein [Martelella alba]TPW29804.1 DUF3971 domain-containing protein [Martelella alba]